MLPSTKRYATAICSIMLFGSQAVAQINPNIAWGVTGNNELWHLSSSG